MEELELHEPRIEILDFYNNLKLIALVELVSPTNNRPGAGRNSYEAKQQEILESDCHLIEIDLLRNGNHVVSVPEWRVACLQPFDYLVCISRWPKRHRYEVYARRLQDRLPCIHIPLAESDPDVSLDVQLALEQVYEEGRYYRRVRYDESCEPPLSAEDQRWAFACWRDYKEASLPSKGEPI